MLILTRRVGEALMVGDDVIIRVLGIKGHQIRLGIKAPKEVSVHREEIYQRIQQEKQKKPGNLPIIRFVAKTPREQPAITDTHDKLTASS